MQFVDVTQWNFHHGNFCYESTDKILQIQVKTSTQIHNEQRMFDSLMELTSEEGRKAILSLITSVISDHPGVIFAALLVVAILLILPMVSSSTPSH